MRTSCARRVCCSGRERGVLQAHMSTHPSRCALPCSSLRRLPWSIRRFRNGVPERRRRQSETSLFGACRTSRAGPDAQPCHNHGFGVNQGWLVPDTLQPLAGASTQGDAHHRREHDPGGSAGLQTRWVAPRVAGWVRLPFPSAILPVHALQVSSAGIPTEPVSWVAPGGASCSVRPCSAAGCSPVRGQYGRFGSDVIIS